MSGPDDHAEPVQVSPPKDGGRGLRARLLQEGDVKFVRTLIRQGHAKTVLRALPTSDAKLDEQITLMLTHPPGMIGPVAVWNGRPVGGAWAEAAPSMLTDGPLVVSVHIIAVDLALPPVRRAKVFLALVAAVREWAQSLKASHSFIHVTTGSKIKATDRLMKAAGAQFVGGAYALA